MSCVREGRTTRSTNRRQLLLPSNVTASTTVDTADALIASYLLSQSNPSFLRAASGSRTGPRHQPACVDDFVSVVAPPDDSEKDSPVGRITHLRLCEYTTSNVVNGDGADAHIDWDLDPCIGRLDELRRLDVKGCRSIPAELARLKHLEFLFLDSCRGLVNVPPRDISAVKTIYLSGCWNERSLRLFVIWATRFAVNLRTLRCTHLETPPFNPTFLEGIRSNTATCQNLQTLDLKYCGLRQEDLEDLFFDSLLPNSHRYPQLTVLDLANNDIDSLQKIAERIACIPNNNNIDGGGEGGDVNGMTTANTNIRLRQLILTRNPVLERTETSEEHNSIVTVLKYFQELGCLGFPRCSDSNGKGNCGGRGKKRLKAWHPELEYWLRINRCGRVLVEGRMQQQRGVGGGTSRTNDSLVDDDYGDVIALSIWPRVLERAYQTANYGVFQEDLYTSEDDIPYRANRATGLFYLLRHKPDLVGKS